MNFVEVQKVMQCFPNSFINYLGEVILDKKTNIYFNAKSCETSKDIQSKLLEWCSRPLAKGIFYKSDKKNSEYKQGLIDNLNKYLDTEFNEADMWLIYENLGNEVNHKLTLEFIDSGFDMSVLGIDKSNDEELER